jgi:hypothetical protein
MAVDSFETAKSLLCVIVSGERVRGWGKMYKQRNYEKGKGERRYLWKAKGIMLGENGRKRRKLRNEMGQRGSKR